MSFTMDVVLPKLTRCHFPNHMTTAERSDRLSSNPLVATSPYSSSDPRLSSNSFPSPNILNQTPDPVPKSIKRKRMNEKKKSREL